MEFNKYQRYRQKCISEGRCPHCGKPCAPYYECEERREYKRNKTASTHYKKSQGPRKKIIPNISIEQIHKIVNSLDPGMNKRDPLYKAAVIMLAGLSVGQNMPRLARLTGYEYAFIKFVKWNLKKGKIWLKNDSFDLLWFEQKNYNDYCCLFWLYAMVGEGSLVKKGEFFKMTRLRKLF